MFCFAFTFSSSFNGLTSHGIIFTLVSRFTISPSIGRVSLFFRLRLFDRGLVSKRPIVHKRSTTSGTGRRTYGTRLNLYIKIFFFFLFFPIFFYSCHTTPILPPPGLVSPPTLHLRLKYHSSGLSSCTIWTLTTVPATIHCGHQLNTLNRQSLHGRRSPSLDGPSTLLPPRNDVRQTPKSD